jgi:hypothetical protein
MIQIMNAGSGAGKTYALIQWVKEKDNRYIVGLNAQTGDIMADEGLSHKFIHYVDAKDHLEGLTDPSGVGIAFDNFDWVLPGLLFDAYGVNVDQAEIILSTNLPDADLLPSYGIRVLNGPYAANLIKMYGDKK